MRCAHPTCCTKPRAYRESPPSPRRHLEEIHDPGLERILCTDDEQAIIPDQLLEELRPMPQVIDRSPDVRAHRLLDERVDIVDEVCCQQCLDRRTNSIDDRHQVPRLILPRPAELL